MDQNAASLLSLLNGIARPNQNPQQQMFQILQQLQQSQQQPQQMNPALTQQLLMALAQHQQQAGSDFLNMGSPQAQRQVKTPKRKSVVKENEPPMGYPVKVEPQNVSSMTSLKLKIDQQNGHHSLPLSSLTSIDDGLHSSSTSPTETHSGPGSPLESENLELPKEHEHADRKRPAAIAELLHNKKKRLELKKENDPSTEWTFPQPEDDTETVSSNCSIKQESKKVSEISPADIMANLFSNNPLDTTTDSEVKVSELFGEVPPDWSLASSSGDVYESPNSRDIPHDQTFAQVPGRLSLLSNVTKYKMSVAEVRRRVLGPESFNFSLLGALLRRAKMPEKSQALFQELQQVGLQIPRGRRRNYSVSLLSALTEAESEQLVTDFGKVSETNFPCQEYVELSYAAHRSDNLNQLVARLSELEATRKVLSEFLELLKMDRSEFRDKKPEPILPSKIQAPLSTYSMLTHGFGTPALQVGVKMLGTFVEKQIEMLRNEVTHLHSFKA